MIKKISYIMAIPIWIAASFILILSLLTQIEITNTLIRNLCLIVSFSGVLFVNISLLFPKKPKATMAAIIISFVCISVYLKEEFKWNGDWKTQTIIYENGHFNNKTIEFQMQDKGALGNNRRIVEVTKFTFFLKLIEPVDTTKIDLPWILVNKHVNELRLKPI